MATPSIGIKFSGNAEKGVGTLRESAKAAAQDMQRLQRELSATARSGQQISAIQGEALRAAQRRSDQLQELIKRDKEAAKHFRTEKYYTGLGRKFLGAAQGGGVAGVAEFAEHLFSGRKGVKFLNKIGMGGAAEALQRAIPQIYMANEVREAVDSSIEEMHRSNESRGKVRELFAEQKIDAPTMKRIMENSKSFMDWRDWHLPIVGRIPFTQSSSEVIEKNLQSMQAFPKELEAFKNRALFNTLNQKTSFYEYQAMLLGNPTALMGGYNKVKNALNAQSYAAGVEKLDKELEQYDNVSTDQKNIIRKQLIDEIEKTTPGFSAIMQRLPEEAKKARAEELAKIREEVIAKPYEHMTDMYAQGRSGTKEDIENQIEKRHPGFKDLLKRVEADINKLRTEDDVKKRTEHQSAARTLTTQYELENQALINRAWNLERRKGYVPMNRIN